MKPIVNLDEIALDHQAHGDRFEARGESIGPLIGARLLGYSLTVVPPGKRAWPKHNHHVNEEAFVILDGTGSYRLGDVEYPVRAGDVIAAPPGDRATGHQLVNTGDRDLRYLSFSTMIPHDIVEYPDSGKVSIRAAPTADAAPTFRYRGLLDSPRDYWDGE